MHVNHADPLTEEEQMLERDIENRKALPMTPPHPWPPPGRDAYHDGDDSPPLVASQNGRNPRDQITGLFMLLGVAALFVVVFVAWKICVS